MWTNSRFGFGVQRIGHETGERMYAIQFLGIGGRREVRHGDEAHQTDASAEAFCGGKFAVRPKRPNAIVSQARLKRNSSISRGQELELRRAWLRIWEDAFERRL